MGPARRAAHPPTIRDWQILPSQGPAQHGTPLTQMLFVGVQRENPATAAVGAEVETSIGRVTPLAIASRRSTVRRDWRGFRISDGSVPSSSSAAASWVSASRTTSSDTSAPGAAPATCLIAGRVRVPSQADQIRWLVWLSRWMTWVLSS
jgi:hypothetical protein